ncbi:flagellar basal-body rod protein FlgB [Melghiribacillus thermohalophilus]|uniref:Flagellar basal body rod protein FlgB n=1 Tax=Melghiribacillus thermohalophilus TaxID=1324956 RepID=A0A4R3NH33_9BACI|nr:flagellar basal body rod protein FlgB [Melghiribacillus thermohalophilus]TCT26778.1 flagellar basal-body rod protein FlgB [Melghiribacillus thermohalophilus]
MSLFGETIHTLENYLDYSALKNKTISNNIANTDTPNYKAKDVVFKDIFHETLQSPAFEAKRTHPKHIPFSSTSSQSPYSIITRSNTNYNHNGNNVDIDKEMVDLAKNQIYYQALVDRLNGKFGSLQTVIRGGK